MNRRTPSLRNRLRTQFLLLGAVPVLAVFVAAWTLVVPVLTEQAEARNNELALAVRDQVQLQLDVRERTASLLANHLRVGRPPREALLATMEAMLQGDRFLQAVYVADEHGRVQEAAFAEQSGRFAGDAVGLDLSGQTYFARAREGGKAEWSDTFLSTLSGQITLVLAIPAGRHTVVAELSLAALSQSLVDVSQTGTTRVVIVDRAGRIVAHPDPRQALRQENLRDMAIVREALDGRATSARVVVDGSEHYARALPVATIGWAVFAAQPMAAVLAPVVRLGGAVAAVLVATVILSMLWGISMARRTGREVTQLADAAQVLALDASEPPALQFSNAEFNAVWTRLRDLFHQLHLRDRQTRAAQQELQAVLDAATEVAIIATDDAGQVTMFNIGAQRMLGYPPGEVAGRLTPLAWHDPDEVAARARALGHKYGRPIEGMEALVVEARLGGHEVRDWTFQRRDGSRLDVSLAVTSVRTPEGEIKGFLGVAIDVTERRRAAELDLARKAAELSSQAKSDFLSRMSHELRTPLNAVLGYAQLLATDPEHPADERQRDGLEHIERAGWHLVHLIDDVLDLSRIESGHLRLTIGPVDTAAAIEQARRMVAPQALRHGVGLTVQLIGRGPAPRVAADETRLAQVLVNLLGNAIKYNRPQGSVTLEYEPVAGSVVLRVIDTGRGMSPEQIARMFEPFNRLGMEGSTIEGSGIGLVITRHLVERMHGRLEVESTPGVGSTFVVTLPAAQAKAEPEPLALPDGAAAAPSRGRVFYIEDNEVNAVLMRAILEQRPEVDLQVFTRARPGLEAIRADPPDLLLLDMHLPDGTGETVIVELHADERLARIPVVVVSADATQARMDAMRQRGVVAYLTKPLDVTQTLREVDRALAHNMANSRPA